MKIIQYGASHRILDAFLDVTSGDRRVFSQLNLSILNHGVDVDVIFHSNAMKDIHVIHMPFILIIHLHIHHIFPFILLYNMS